MTRLATILAALCLVAGVVTAPRATVPGPVVTGLQSLHRQGQTFLTWREVGDPFPADPTYEAYERVIRDHAHLRYRVYRHTAVIDATTLPQARLIAEIEVGSGFNVYLHGHGRASAGPPHRFVIEEGKGGWGGSGELPANAALHVHTVAFGDHGPRYYAVTVVTRGVENRVDFGPANALRGPIVEESSPSWKPILQNNPERDRFSHYTEPGIQHIFTRWEAEPLDSRNSWPHNYMVVVFPSARKPYKVDLSLHCWGASLTGCIPWVYYPDGLFVTSTDYLPQSWWTGWNSDFFAKGGCGSGACRGVNRYYTMRRMLSFLDWMKTRWPIDDTRIMCSGNSMGGSGASIFCLRHGEVFNYATSWVGISIPHGSPTFANEYENVFGPMRQGLVGEDGIATWDDLDMAKWLRAHPRKETPFITFSNGKNDGAIGWPQAVAFYQALRDTRRPFTFVWGQDGHSQRSLDVAVDRLTDRADLARVDFQRTRAVPAFGRFSLDDDPGNGDPASGAPTGTINAYQRWDPNTIVDTATRFEIDLWLVSQAPVAAGTTDVTPRNVQTLKARSGQPFHWQLLEGRSVVQQGSGTADGWDLVTIPGVELRRGAKRRLVVELREGGRTAERATAVPPAIEAPVPAKLPAAGGEVLLTGSELDVPGCGALPPPRAGGPVFTVGPERAAELPDLVASALPGTTILLQDGIYPLGSRGLVFSQPRVTLRSWSGSRDAVVLDGQGYRTPTGIKIQANHVTVADLTIREVHYHPIHVSGGGDHVLLYNLHILDGRQQLVKVNPGPGGLMNDRGTVACSLLELTERGRAHIERHPTPALPCYTGGIDAHQAWGWVVRDSVFRNIYCAKGIAEAAIHFWSASRDTVVERNRIFNCARGIGFGLGPDGGQRLYPDMPSSTAGPRPGHFGGLIRNNLIWSDMGPLFDTGIGLEQARGARVYHNTVWALEGFSSIDARFTTSDPHIANNLTSLPMTVRDGGRPRAERNLETATADMFANAALGDLRLTIRASGAIARGLDLRRDVPADVDGTRRAVPPDLGAHELAEGPTSVGR